MLVEVHQQPEGQFIHSLFPLKSWYVYSEQLIGAELPCGHLCPMGQMLAGLFGESDCSGQKYPAKHDPDGCDNADLSQQNPAVHFQQLLYKIFPDSEENVPAGHGTGTDDPSKQ